jgi:hypothetical protein
MVQVLNGAISWGSILVAVALTVALLILSDAPDSTRALVFAIIVSLALVSQLPSLLIGRGKGLTALASGILFLLSALATTLYVSPLFGLFALFAIAGIVVSLFLIDRPRQDSRSR